MRDAVTDEETWEPILEIFERYKVRNKLAARRDFYAVTMLDNENVLPYIRRVRYLGARLKSIAVVIDDKKMTMKVLNGLLQRFKSLIVALDALGPEENTFGV